MRDFTTSDTDLSAAAQLLQDGGIVAFPTETVFGLGADATNPKAVAKIFAAKGRPSFNPLIVHFASAEHANEWVDVSGQAQKLMDAFWPGPLTLVLPLRGNTKIAKAVTAGLPTLAIRVPDQPIARTLIQKSNRPIAAPSANLSGKISPTTRDHVRAGLSGKIDGLVCAGPCAVGLESTIVTFDPGPIILRPGAITRSDLELVLASKVALAKDTKKVTAPGQLSSHYAPQVAVRLNVIHPEPNEVFLGFGDIDGDVTLSASGDMAEAAEKLFAMLHELDKGERPIAVAPIPNQGIGRAINDRLKRAAAPRS